MMIIKLLSSFIPYIVLCLSEPYTAWVKVPLTIKNDTASPEGEAAFGKLILLSVANRDTVKEALINATICHIIGAKADRKQQMLTSEGTRVIKNVYDGPVKDVVNSIRERVREELLLAVSDVDEFVELETDPTLTNLVYPARIKFELGNFYVNNDLESPIKCPVTPKVFMKKHFRRQSLWYVALLVLILSVVIIFIGMRFLSPKIKPAI